MSCSLFIASRTFLQSISRAALASVVLATIGLQLSAFAAAPLTATSSGRNDGLCYWHCAQSVLWTRGVGRDLMGEVRQSGTPSASLPNIERFVTVTPVPLYQHAKQLTAQHVHVIANLRFDLRVHAVVIIDVSNGIVTYYDPDKPRQNQRMLENEFAKRYLMGTVIQ